MLLAGCVQPQEVPLQEHRWDTNINELKNHFNDVINWIESIFDEVYPQMKGLN